jgi:hypothetical protein
MSFLVGAVIADAQLAFSSLVLSTLASLSFQEFTSCRAQSSQRVFGMGALDYAFTTLNVLGATLQVVPFVGDNLKGVVELATKICETVQVRHRCSRLLRSC